MSPTTRTPGGPADGNDEESKAERERREARAMESMMWTVVGHMAASLLVYGGVGYLLGRWLGHPILLLFGVLFGMAVSLAYTVWVGNRGGRQH